MSGCLGTKVIGHPLGQHHHVVVLIGEGRGTRKQHDLGRFRELRQGTGSPFHSRPVVDRVTPGQQLTAHLGLLVDKHHACAGTSRTQPGR